MHWVLVFNYGNVFSLEKGRKTAFITSINNDCYIVVKVFFIVSEQPISLTGYGKMSDSVHVLYTVNRIALYINNILWDEDWPAGTTSTEDCELPEGVRIIDADKFIKTFSISTNDLRTWHEHPMAVTIDHCYESSICTGSLIYYNCRYYAFYAVHMFDRSPART